MRTKHIKKYGGKNQTRKKYKRQTKKYYKKYYKNKTKRNQSGGDKELEKQFRNQFRDLLLPLINWKNKSNNDIKKFTRNIKNFFETNKASINTLIPVDVNMKPVLTGIVDYVSIPTVIMDNITNKEIKQKLIELFYENGGNINVESRRSNTKNNVFNRVVENRQKDNIEILLEPRYGLTRDNLKEENKPIFDEIMRTIEVVPQVQVAPQIVAPQVEQIVTPQIEQIVAPQVEQIVVPQVEEQIVVPQVEEQIVVPQVEEQIVAPQTEQIVAPQIEQIVAPQIVKLNFFNRLPSIGYKLDVAPKFWRNMFAAKGTDLFELRERVKRLLFQDSQLKVSYRNSFKENPWTTCEIIERMFPAYYTKKNPDFGLNNPNEEIDFVNTNTALCIILLLLGMISYKMEGQDYNFIFKGGKSVQFVLSEIQNTSKYISDDIDILLTHSDSIEYDKIKMEILAKHISFLIKWFLEGTINISLDLPNTSTRTLGKDIIKISYLGVSGKYKALCDVGFEKPSEIVRPYFEHPQVFKMYNAELQTDLMFRCPNIDAILDEKLYYYLKFIQLRDIINQGSTIQEEGYEDMNLVTLNFYIQKFKKSIKAIVDGLIMKQFGNIDKTEITDNERMILQYKLNKFNANNNFKEEVIKSVLNSNPYEV